MIAVTASTFTIVAFGVSCGALGFALGGLFCTWMHH